MKKLISLSLALMLLLGVLAVPAMAEEKTCGVLSYLNITEEESTTLSEAQLPLLEILFLHGVLDGGTEKNTNISATYRFFDTLNDMLLALQAGTVDAIKVPYYTGLYLSSTNDNLKLTREYHPENINESAQRALDMISDGYSFMLKEENEALRDEFNAQITAMKEDGTLQKLIDEHIIKAAEGGEPVAVAFENLKGIRLRSA